MGRSAIVSLLLVCVIFCKAPLTDAQSTCSPCSLTVQQFQKISPKSVTITSACEETTPVNFCEVIGALVSDRRKHDSIKFEVALPDASAWNGKYVFIGNGLFGGKLPTPGDGGDFAQALTDGYAVAATDTGHNSCDNTNDATKGDCDLTEAAWALHNLPSVKDFAYRAVHRSTVAARKIVKRFYNSTITEAYFQGCSTGGRQALVEAEKYPDDFDGIIAGDPAAGNIFAGFNWNEQAQLQIASPTPSPSLDYPAIRLIDTAVRALCGETTPGLTTTPLILDPPTCPFQSAPATTPNSLASLECTSGQTSGCLTANQIATVNAFLDGPVDTTGAQIYPGYSPSDPGDTTNGDTGWYSFTDCTQFDITDPGGCIPPVPPYPPTYAPEPWGFADQPPVALPNFTAEGPLQWVAQDGYLRNFVYEDVNYAPLTFSFQDQKAINKLTKNIARWGGDGMEVSKLTSFVKKNHMLLLYHGWSDPVITPYNTVNLFASIQSIFGADTGNNIRLFMVPGMHHCSGGPGPNVLGPAPGSSDLISVLDQWVSGGNPPDGNSATNPLIATHFVNNVPGGAVDRTMPLCAYPELPVYIGAPANPEVAPSWTCSAPPS